MGYNATVVVMVDGLHEIRDDPEFGKKLSDAIRDFQSARSKHSDVRAGSHLNAATVVGFHHADVTSVVLVGGNCATKLHEHYGWRHNDPAVQVDILKEVADKLGYRLIKKPEGKK